MEAFIPLLEAILILLTAVGTSVVVATVTRVPIAWLQIVFGLLLTPYVQAATINDPELFLLLFVAPLLFIDAYLAPREELLQVKGTIAWMAVGLVLFTVFAGGFFLYWLLRGIPLAMSIALAAVLAPTDAVALSSSMRGVQVYAPLARILEGEALLNDATALVCFRIALLAEVTGSFSWFGPVTSFLVVGLGGVLVGTTVALVMAQVEMWIQRTAGPQPASQVLLALLLPFGTYLLAQSLHCSGILAAVTAGLVLARRIKERVAPETRAHGIEIFEMLRTASNGMIFIFLGARLPSIVEGMDRHVLPSFGKLSIYVFAVGAFLTVLRIVWALPVVAYFRRANSPFKVPVSEAGALAFFGVAGQRGALTMASVLSLPLSTSMGSPLPARELAIVLAMGVILLSLTSGPFLLPLLNPLLTRQQAGSHAAIPQPILPSGISEGLSHQ